MAQSPQFHFSVTHTTASLVTLRIGDQLTAPKRQDNKLTQGLKRGITNQSRIRNSNLSFPKE